MIVFSNIFTIFSINYALAELKFSCLSKSSSASLLHAGFIKFKSGLLADHSKVVISVSNTHSLTVFCITNVEVVVLQNAKSFPIVYVLSFCSPKVRKTSLYIPSPSTTNRMSQKDNFKEEYS